MSRRLYTGFSKPSYPTLRETGRARWRAGGHGNTEGKTVMTTYLLNTTLATHSEDVPESMQTDLWAFAQ